MVTDQEDGVLGVESDVQTLSLLHGSVLAKEGVLSLVEIPNEESTLVSTSGKDGGAVRSPFNISDSVLEVEGDDGSSDLHVPHLDGPIS